MVSLVITKKHIEENWYPRSRAQGATQEECPQRDATIHCPYLNNLFGTSDPLNINYNACRFGHPRAVHRAYLGVPVLEVVLGEGREGAAEVREQPRRRLVRELDGPLEDADGDPRGRVRRQEAAEAGVRPQGGRETISHRRQHDSVRARDILIPSQISCPGTCGAQKCVPLHGEVVKLLLELDAPRGHEVDVLQHDPVALLVAEVELRHRHDVLALPHRDLVMWSSAYIRCQGRRLCQTGINPRRHARRAGLTRMKEHEQYRNAKNPAPFAVNRIWTCSADLEMNHAAVDKCRRGPTITLEEQRHDHACSYVVIIDVALETAPPPLQSEGCGSTGREHEEDRSDVRRVLEGGGQHLDEGVRGVAIHVCSPIWQVAQTRRPRQRL
eukprot:gene83-biopygen24